MLMAIAMVLLMIGFIKICSVHTPTHNPRLPKHKPIPGTYAFAFKEFITILLVQLLILFWYNIHLSTHKLSLLQRRFRINHQTNFIAVKTLFHSFQFIRKLRYRSEPTSLWSRVVSQWAIMTKQKSCLAGAATLQRMTQHRQQARNRNAPGPSSGRAGSHQMTRIKWSWVSGFNPLRVVINLIRCLWNAFVFNEAFFLFVIIFTSFFMFMLICYWLKICLDDKAE